MPVSGVHNAIAAGRPAKLRGCTEIRGMTDGREFWVLESCLRIFFRQDGVLDAYKVFQIIRKYEL